MANWFTDFFLQENKKENVTYAIGDIHGCAAELEKLISMLTIDSSTALIFLGNYINIGPNSRKAIDLILELKSRCNVIGLMGKHESMLIQFLEHPESSEGINFIFCGGGVTLSEYALPDGTYSIPEEHLSFLKSLQYFYQTDKYFFVNSGVPADKDIDQIDPSTDRDSFLGMKKESIVTKRKWKKQIIHGHSPKIFHDKNKIRVNCDTGCVYGGSLTAYDVNHDRFISVKKLTNGQVKLPRNDKTADGTIRSNRFNGRIAVVAGMINQPKFSFETINYNQFGLLIRQTNIHDDIELTVNAKIEGVIGDDPLTSFNFEGVIVRITKKAGVSLFGVKVIKVSKRE